MTEARASYPRLLGDIGGTNARFAWQAEPGAALTTVSSYRCGDYDSVQVAIAHYLHAHHHRPPAACALGVATAVDGDRITLTNHRWSFSTAELRTQLGVRRLAVVNDFTALALSLPGLRDDERVAIGGPDRLPVRGPLAVLGPGTGLGVSGLLPVATGGWVPVSGEGGHATLAATNRDEAEIIELLRRHHGHVSAERALSGPGLVSLYRAVCERAGRPARFIEPQQIVVAAATDVDCQHAIDVFLAFLGSVAGNLALILGARGGVYVGGGIVPRLMHRLPASEFRQRFEAKGRFSGYLQAIPTFAITATESPALRGASEALDAQSGSV